MDGFFPETMLLENRPEPQLVPRCGACGLFRRCRAPKMPLAGRGHKKILVIGEAPGEMEDQTGKPFQGPSGRLLRDHLQGLGVDLFADCWVTNALICRPTHSEGRNRTPTAREISYCRPNVLRALEELQPEVVLLLGAVPVRSLLGWLWKEQVGALARWVGWRIPSQRLNAWVCPTYHPAAVLREQEKKDEVMTRLFRRHLQAALGCAGRRPWQVLPHYERRVQLVEDPHQAAALLENFRAGGPLALDYETNMLKPDSTQAEIVSCAVSNGQRTIAYPWVGAAMRATGALLRSGAPVIASNAKFEERFTRRFFQHGVKHWHWDTMLAAHVLDNRPGITSIKFQAFVLLGQDSWDEHIRPYFRGAPNQPNRIRQIDWRTLLTYNGLDALLEWEVCQRQRQQLLPHVRGGEPCVQSVVGQQRTSSPRAWG